MDHYFFWGGGDVRNCPKKIPAQQKMLKNGTRETMGKKLLASAFYYYYYVKKLLVHKLMATKIIIAYPLPFIKIMVNPHVCLTYFLIYNVMSLN